MIIQMNYVDNMQILKLYVGHKPSNSNTSKITQKSKVNSA